MSSHDVTFGGTGIPQTILDPESPELLASIAAAESGQPEERRAALAGIAETSPASLHVWAALGDAGRDTIESYAAYRVGYHRGLDALRRSGWRGSGHVRWEHSENRGFLRCLYGLQRTAEAIGESDEAQRCELFLKQLDPSWSPPSA